MSGNECSSGFAVRGVDDGKRAMATAGHCSNGTTGVAATSGEYRFGTFVRSLYNTEVDAALLGGTPAKPQVYAPTIWVDGGTPSTPVARVKQVECALNAKVLTTTDAESGDTTPPPPRTDCRQPGLSGPVS